MESEKISKLKILWDGIKHIACAVWGEYIPVRRKEIKAEELEEICEMLSPSPSRFLEHLHKRGVETSEETERQLSYAFDRAFDSLFPEEITNEKINGLVHEFRHILGDGLGRFDMGINYSFVKSMVVDDETILTRIKNKGLEKHIIFHKHRSSYVSGESFWSATKEFLTEKLYDSPNNKDSPANKYSAGARVGGYMSKWSFVFNRKVVPVSSSIEIKNLKIIGDLQINFERFTCVVFSRNKFCESVKIKATRDIQLSDKDRLDVFVFYKNFFCHDYCVNFRDIYYFIFDQNNFKRGADLFNSPRPWSGRIKTHNDIYPSIRLINNKIEGRLAIKSRKPDNDNNDYIPIEIKFLRRNRLAGLRIDTDNNELSEAMTKSDIENISFDVHEEINPPDSDLYLLDQHKEFFLKLKNQAIEKKDRSAELIYARQGRYFDRRLSSRWEDRLIFWSSEFVSKSGISWGRPLIILSILQVICIALPVWWITKDCELGVRLAIETLNPLTTLSAKLSEESYWISFLTVFQKIYLSILLYEIIKVLRRFSK